MRFPLEPPHYPVGERADLDDSSLWSINNTHDPALVSDGGTYYVFSTDRALGPKQSVPFRAGIQVRTSDDLIHWRWHGQALDGIPSEAAAWTNCRGLWAPDAAKIGKHYYLYYAASQFGKTQSYIGVLRGTSMEGPWQDLGEVIKSEAGTEGPNAIDPNVVWDAHGAPWLVYGSFFGGLYIKQLDPQTGKCTELGLGNCLARRPRSVDRALEGPYVVYNPKYQYYYLFLSYDSLFSTYNIRVGRSRSVNGPYVDYLGRALTDIEYPDPHAVGTKLAGSYAFGDDAGWIGPGHNSILQEGESFYIAHHARTGARNFQDWSYLHVRKVLWTDDGWPLLSPQRYAGEQDQNIPSESVAGIWDVIRFRSSNHGMEHSQTEIWRSDGTVTSSEGQPLARWQLRSDTLMLESTEAPVIQAKLSVAWDHECWNPTIVFTGLDQWGQAVWGKQLRQGF